MSKVDSKVKNPLVKSERKAAENLPTRPSYNVPANKQSLPPAHFENSREVAPLEAQYSDLLKPKEMNLKAHLLPVAAIFVFSLVLVVIFHVSNPPGKVGSGRGVSGDLNDLSNGAYQSQTADYQEEKVCVDHPDGTKSCTTKTKLHRAFR